MTDAVTTNNPEQIKALEEDRKAAVALIRQIDHRTEYLSEIEDGSYDENFFVQAFATHRIASTASSQSRIEMLEGALEGFGSDFMTSEAHHPGYVLIPTEQFERIRTALKEPGR